jgi:GH18 family chitinase
MLDDGLRMGQNMKYICKGTTHFSKNLCYVGRNKSSLFYLQDSAIKYWIQKGAPKDKLNLGIATYGRSFTLQNANNNGVGAPTKDAGKPGPYTEEAGYLGYNEVQQFLSYKFSSFYTQT